jgi:hypothetical protein
MMSPALTRWPSLAASGLMPEELQRIDWLMTQFFLPPIDLDTKFNDVLQAVTVEMDRAPEIIIDCDPCDGKGYIPRVTHVYEAGCGFSHPDVEEVRCESCGGAGWFVCEAEGD